MSANQSTVFYSWASDHKNQKKEIENTLRAALKATKKQLNIDLVIDRDTKGKSGAIDIIDSIFEKIDHCRIFVADLSFIGSKWRFRNQKFVNQNVLFETGYALRKLGENNLILIFNKKYGSVDDLPFDINKRRILCFNDDYSDLESKIIDAINTIIKSSNIYIVPNRDMDENHDILVFNRVMESFPEENYKYILDHFCASGYYEYSSTSFIRRTIEKLQNPSNVFIHAVLREKAFTLQTALSELDGWMALNCFTVRNNTNMARINQFEGVRDWNKQDQLIWELQSEQQKFVDSVLESYQEFRISIGQILRV